MFVSDNTMPDSPFDFDANPAMPTTDYDVAVRQSIPGYDALFSMVSAFLQLHLTNNAQILIVGAGGGNEIATLGQANPHWQLTGVDPSEKMLAVAQTKIADLDLADRVTLSNGRVQDLSQHQFDAATSILVMHFLPDDGAKLDYLQAIASRLKPGSPFLLVDLQGDKQAESFQRLVAAWQRRAEIAGMAKQRSTDLVSGMWQHLSCIPESRTLELLDQANFKSATRFYTAFVYTGWLAFAG